MKEELRKEFVDELRKGITFAGQVGDYVINQSLFDWFYSKLEAKYKEIAELKQTIEMRNDYYETKIENLNKAYGNEFKENLDLINQIADLKAKLEAAENVIKTLIP